MRPETLQNVLTREQRLAGLHLDEPDDHTLQLRRGDEILASWYPSAVTAEAIREEAGRHI